MVGERTRRRRRPQRNASRRGQRSARRLLPVALLLCAAVLFGFLIGLAPADEAPTTTEDGTYAEAITDCRATDGDTLRCGQERIRLLAIDAPEMPGHCRTGRVCAPGDPDASKASLQAALEGSLTIERVSQDRYGRTLARVASARGDLSCWQLARDQAIYRSDWDDGGRVAGTCPNAVR